MTPADTSLSVVARFAISVLLGAGLFGQRSFADSVSFDPPSGNALTPMTITVDGFIGTNGPVPVSVNGDNVSSSCSSTRPCTLSANMGNFSGKHWVVASALVDGQSVMVSNSFTVRDAHAFINRACGPGGTKVIVTGYDFGRNSTIYVDTSQTQADAAGRFTATVNIPGGPSGPFKIIATDGFRNVTNEFNIGAAAVCEEEIGHVANREGGVTLQRPGGQPQPLNPGDPVRLGDEIRTGAGGKVDVVFMDDTSLSMPQNGRLVVNTQIYDPANGSNDRSSFSILEGAFRYVSGFVSKHDDNVQVNTGFGVLGIRGTEFISRRDPCSSTQEVYLIHGQLAVIPVSSATTNVIDAPATIFFDATNVWTSGLTQAAYDALLNEHNQTNPVTFASWLVQYFGCTNDNPAAAFAADPDGDGQNNYAEFLTHTDPTTNASVFKLVGIAREADGVRLTWQTHGGITNVVQAAASPHGGYTNVGPNLAIPGDVDITTNYFDSGAITNARERFYRVRLAP